MNKFSYLPIVCLNVHDPIPDNIPYIEVSLLEKSIYGHIHNISPFSLTISMPAIGARRIMDIVLALRTENSNEEHNALALQEMVFPATVFGIILPMNQTGEVVIRSSGLCEIRIADRAGIWKRTFWLNMQDINHIGATESSCLVEDVSSIGNMKVDCYLLKGFSHGMRHGEAIISAPVLSSEFLELLSSRIIPWHGVDPVKDGRFGVCGHILDNTLLKYGAMDIFAREKDDQIEGIVIVSTLADQKPNGKFMDVVQDVLKKLPKSQKDIIQRAVGDLTMTYMDIEPEKRIFHNNCCMNQDQVLSILKKHNMSIEESGHNLYIFHNGKIIDENIYEDIPDEMLNIYNIARFARIMLNPLRGYPFLFRRKVNMTVPLDALEHFIPKKLRY